MNASTRKNAVRSSWPGTCTFMPQIEAISVSGRKITQKAVRIRKISFERWAIADSFVSSSASTTSL